MRNAVYPPVRRGRLRTATGPRTVLHRGNPSARASTERPLGDHPVPIVRVTPVLARHVDAPTEHADGATARAVLDAYFARHPQIRGYVMDDQGELRRHVTLFVGGRPIRDRAALTDRIADDEALDIMQALSGG